MVCANLEMYESIFCRHLPYVPRSVTAGGGGSEMGQSKDGTASDLTSVFEAAEHSENTTGTEGHMSAAGTCLWHVLF